MSNRQITIGQDVKIFYAESLLDLLSTEHALIQALNGHANTILEMSHRIMNSDNIDSNYYHNRHRQERTESFIEDYAKYEAVEAALRERIKDYANCL